jgi:hypothetical protein
MFLKQILEIQIVTVVFIVKSSHHVWDDFDDLLLLLKSHPCTIQKMNRQLLCNPGDRESPIHGGEGFFSPHPN